MRGNKKLMGSIKRKDFGLLGYAMHAVLEDLEEYWLRINSEEQRKEIEDLEVFVIIEYCGILQGEEVQLLPLKVILCF